MFFELLTTYWQKQYNAIDNDLKDKLGENDVFCGVGNEWVGYINNQETNSGVGYGSSGNSCPTGLKCAGGETIGNGDKQVEKVINTKYQ